jgi:dolichol-phosphate mannosyltransferase
VTARTTSLVSVVTPAYNEAENLPILHERLSQVFASSGTAWEWVVVDDHSADETFAVLCGIAKANTRVRGIRLARNSGSHAAVMCGLDHARGDSVIVMAADLQDPPEVVPSLLSQWQAGAQVVWAVRTSRREAKRRTVLLARFYYVLMRRVAGLKEMPATGADFFLMDRRVMEAFRQFQESNVSIFALITWMGFRQASIGYERQARLHGRSGWTVGKKLKLLLDSITAFTYLPIRAMACLGSAVTAIGLLFVGVTVTDRLASGTPPGWAWVMGAVVVLAGVQMVMLGVLGEYVWRTLEEARRRPRYLIETTTDTSGLGVLS